MSHKRHKPEEIVAKLRQVDVLLTQGQTVADAIRSIGVTEVTYYRWRIRLSAARVFLPRERLRPVSTRAATFLLTGAGRLRWPPASGRLVSAWVRAGRRSARLRLIVRFDGRPRRMVLG